MEKVLEILKLFGFETALFVAGLAGAWVSSNKVKLTKWERLTSVISGGFIANYITPLFAELIEVSESAKYGSAFIVGYIGMKSVEYIIDYVHKKFESK